MDGLCFKLPSGTNASIGKVLSTQFLAERSQNGGDHRQREQLLCGSPIFWFQQPLLVRLVHFVCCLKSCRRIPCGGRRLRVGSARTFCHQTEKLFFNATCFTISLFYLLAPVIGVNLSRWRRWPSPVSRGEQNLQKIPVWYLNLLLCFAWLSLDQASWIGHRRLAEFQFPILEHPLYRIENIVSFKQINVWDSRISSNFLRIYIFTVNITYNMSYTVVYIWLWKTSKRQQITVFSLS